MNKSSPKYKSEYLHGLNRQQRRAVKHGLKNGEISHTRSLLVIAGAGSGKTKTLAHRVAHLVVSGMDPRRILLLTFSRRAAQEMTSRVRQITEIAPDRQIDMPWSGTFHAIGVKLIREYGPQVGLGSNFSILDRSDAADLMNFVRQDLGFSNADTPFPNKNTCLAIYSFVVNSQLSLKVVLSKHFRWCRQWRYELRRLFRGYKAAKIEQNVIDYDDLLLHWLEIMNDKNIAKDIQNRFDHVLVDEFQDTNRLQADILLKLRPNGDGMTVVGDDAQAIYSFRAATVRNILDFPNQCSPKAKIVTLERNYRSTQPILDASNGVIGFAAERFTKNLFSRRKSSQRPLLTMVADERQQARYVAEQILEAREGGVPLKSQATLFRASSHSAALELELARRKIPFVKYGGAKFLEAAHIKDVISTLRWCENPRDQVAGFRVLQLLPGVGPGTAKNILNGIEGRQDIKKALARINVPDRAKEAWPSFKRLVGRMHLAKDRWPSQLRYIREWYDPLLHHNYDDAQLRAPDIAQLEQIAAGYENCDSFLTELALDPPGDTKTPFRPNGRDQDDDYTILSTIHSAKGQEWRVVRVLNVVDGCIPSAQANDMEEERRLLYVAMTRAKNNLDLIVPQRIFSYQSNQFDDRNVYGIVSRFVPVSLRKGFDSRTWRDRSEALSH